MQTANITIGSAFRYDQVKVYVSGQITLSFIHIPDASGLPEFEAGLIFNGKVEDVCPCHWHEMFLIIENCKAGNFKDFPVFHERMITEWQ